MTDIRVRFAPSPTGYLHVGGLRTALYNYLFAKHHKGTFILRIEDTDRNRFVEGAQENLIRTLKICGIEYDEGPDSGGDKGPYIQSMRNDLYKQYAGQLLEDGNAYPCFCSEEVLTQMREEQAQKGEAVRYDGRCRHIPLSEAKKRMQDEPHVIRLKMPTDGNTTFTDLIRGVVSIPNEQVDDQVLIKSDGYPTYHLANVVDDHLMEISHVIRGEEWLPSVPKHITLYKMLGWELPQFAHLPLLLNSDRTKLSKRQGDVAVEDYLNKGYLPHALVNFVALLGWNPGDDREIFSLEELIDLFSLERVNKSGAVFDVEKLKWMNAQYIKKLADDEAIDFLRPYLMAAGIKADEKVIRQAILSVKHSLETAPDVIDKTKVFFNDHIDISDSTAREILLNTAAQNVIKSLLFHVKNVEEVNLNTFQQVMKSVQKETGIKGKDLWMPVRVAMTGLTAGPELPAIIEAFGKEKMVRILEQVVQMVETENQ